MNRQDFLLKLQELFGDDLKAGLIKGYKAVLSDADGAEFDYNRLHTLLLSEYKYRTAPMPAWFAERLLQVRRQKSEGESLIQRHLREGKAKIISYDAERKEYAIQTPNGVYLFYGE